MEDYPRKLVRFVFFLMSLKHHNPNYDTFREFPFPLN